jgi:hypothetical protein
MRIMVIKRLRSVNDAVSTVLKPAMRGGMVNLVTQTVDMAVNMVSSSAVP